MQDKRTRRIQRVLLALVAGFLVAPIVIYVATFGFHITANHSRWGEMGSAMSGIYSPIFSLLALLVLIGQVRLQSESTTHEFDQAYIQEARSDIQYYLGQLDSALAQHHSSGVTVRSYLHSHFELLRLEAPHDSQQIVLAQEINRTYPKICAVWFALYSIYAGLSSQKKFPYEQNFLAAKQKTIAIIAYQTCVAIDNFHRCLAEGNMTVKYEFSPELGRKLS